jgi:AcrR family transcriptional regulator
MKTMPKAVPARKPAGIRREEIALAALGILGRGGRKALTTAALAGEVGVTTGAIFRHYPSLDEVLGEAVRLATESVEATFPDESLDPLERVIALGRNRVGLMRGEAGIAWLFRSEQASLELPPAVVQDLRTMVRRSRTFVLRALRQGMAAGSIRDDVGAEQLLVVVMGTIHALIGAGGGPARAESSRGGTTRKTFEALGLLLAPPGTHQQPNEGAIR